MATFAIAANKNNISKINSKFDAELTWSNFASDYESDIDLAWSRFLSA